MNSFKVPIRNLFYLLSYTNEMPEMVHNLNDVEDDLITYDFLAEQFLLEVQHLLKRGLVKNYVAQVEETSRLSGRLVMNDSLPMIMGRKPVVVCEKDTFTEDIVLNQIMKTTLENLYRNKLIAETTRRKCYLFWEELPNVSTIILTREVFLRINHYRHNQHYKRMIQLAHLLFELKLLSHQRGDWDLYSANLNEGELNRLFERFLYNFYLLEQRDYRVHGEYMRWNLEGNEAFLPRMETDVSLTHKRKQKKIIIDAKFYRHMFQTSYEKRSFHSHNMYQMFTYLQHQPSHLNVRGIL